MHVATYLEGVKKKTGEGTRNTKLVTAQRPTRIFGHKNNIAFRSLSGNMGCTGVNSVLGNFSYIRLIQFICLSR